MKTQLIEASECAQVLELLQNKHPVVLPTETVYGLAADARSDDACRRIFSIKKRQPDNPLIVHCADIKMAQEYMSMQGTAHSASARLGLNILEALAPGPVTVIVFARPVVSSVARAQANTVAIRIPAHPIFNTVLRLFGAGLAAPSANVSGTTSPTNALMAWEAMAGRVSAIVDGGQCSIGLESTIVDCATKRENGVLIPRIVRPGSITAEELAQNLDMEVEDACYDLTHVQSAERKTAIKDMVVPGMKYRHYAPIARIIPVQLFSARTKQPGETVIKSSNEKKMSALYRGEKIRANSLLELCGILKEKVEREKARYKDKQGKAGMLLGPIAAAKNAQFLTVLQSQGWQLIRCFSHWTVLEQQLYEYFAMSDRLGLSCLVVFSPEYKTNAALHDRINRAASI